VNVDGDETRGGLNGRASHATLLLLRCDQRGTDLWAERITNRYECDQVKLVISDARIRRGAK
jgi:hypothetical protein